MAALHTAGFAAPHELPGDSGVAHVAEHLVAHGPQQLGQRYVLPGLVDTSELSSFTGLTFRGLTCYVASGARGAVDRFSEVVLAALAAPVSDGPSIGAERGQWIDGRWRSGTIEDEIRLRDSAYRRAVTAATTLLCSDDALRNDPAGRRDGLQALTDDEVVRFQARWFTAPRISGIRVSSAKREPLVQHLGSMWSWTPTTRHEVVAGPGVDGARCTFGWRVGLFPAHLRQHNVVAARFLAGLLRATEVRRALADIGAQVEFGPIVDSTLPDPVVVLLVTQRGGILAPDAVETVLRHAALTAAGRSGVQASARQHVDGVEPIVEDEWGSVVIARLVALLADDRSHEIDVDDVVVAVRSLLTTSYQDLRTTNTDYRFGVTDPNPDNRGRATNPDRVDSQPTEPAEPAAIAIRGSSAAPKVLFLRDNACWPGGRIGMSIRFHPARGSSHWVAVADLAARWNGGPLRARGRIVPLGSQAVRCVEWRITQTAVEALTADLARQDFRARSGTCNVGAAPHMPPYSTIAAALAGVPMACAELELAGFAAFPGVRPEVGLWAEFADDVFSIAVTGADAKAEDALRRAGLEIVERLRTWLGSTSVEQPTPCSVELTFERSSPDSWLARTGDTGPGLSEAHAVVDLNRLDPPCPAVVGRVRQVVRDAGSYAFSGRAEPDWGVGILSIRRHKATPVDHTLLPTAMRGLLSGRSKDLGVSVPVLLATTPAEALARGQSEALAALPPLTVPSGLAVRLDRPVTYLHTSN